MYRKNKRNLQNELDYWMYRDETNIKKFTYIFFATHDKNVIHCLVVARDGKMLLCPCLAPSVLE